MRAGRVVGGAALAGAFALVLMFSGYLTYLAVSAFNVPKPEIVELKAGTGTANVSWTLTKEDQSRASEVDHYVVYRAIQPGGPFQKVNEVRGTAAFSDANLENGTPYYYAITACDKRGNESQASEVKNAVPMTCPRGCRAVAGNRRITVSWFPAQIKNLKSYSIYRNGKLVQQTRSTTVVDSDVRRGGRYVYTVRAVAKSGAESSDSNRTVATAYETCTRCGGDGKVTCTNCGGDGRDTQTCWRCGGDGHCNTCGGNGGWFDWWGWWITCGTCGGDGDCNTCGGDGRISSTCSVCNGRGWVTCPACKGRGRLT